MTYRNRALLDLARELPCTINLPGCESANTVPAHSNQQRHGKGIAEKAADVFFAAACRACHHEIDHGKTLSRDERKEAWQRGFEKTLLLLWERGLIVVAHGCATKPVVVNKSRKVSNKKSRFASARSTPSKCERPSKILPRTA